MDLCCFIKKLHPILTSCYFFFRQNCRISKKSFLLKLVNLDVEFDQDSKFCKIFKIGREMWKWEAKTEKKAPKAPWVPRWVKDNLQLETLKNQLDRKIDYSAFFISNKFE